MSSWQRQDSHQTLLDSQLSEPPHYTGGGGGVLPDELDSTVVLVGIVGAKARTPMTELSHGRTFSVLFLLHGHNTSAL